MSLRRPSLAFGAAVLLAAPAMLSQASSPAVADTPSDSYIVMIKNSDQTLASDAMISAASQAKKLGATVTSTFPMLGGFAAKLDQQQLEKLRNDPSVASISRNSSNRLIDSVVDSKPTATKKPQPTKPTTAGSQRFPSWGLDRIDQKKLPLDFRYSWTAEGEGVHIYIVDTGIRASHNEFSGRVGKGYNSVDKNADASDVHGHGTHVAGVAAGKTFGVARKATIHPVRVFDQKGSSTQEQLLGGMEWIAANLETPAVINMSMEGDGEDPKVKAAEKITKKGGLIIAAAGNNEKDACKSFPANYAPALTVSATDINDKFASQYANKGKCVDILAPGSGINSASRSSDSGSESKTGTSQAAPYVAGAAAVYWALHQGSTAEDVSRGVLADATDGTISGVPAGTPNKLLYTGNLK